MTLSELIRHKRKALGITQMDLAARAAVSQATISKLESGLMADVPLLLIRRIAKELKISAKVIWESE